MQLFSNLFVSSGHRRKIIIYLNLADARKTKFHSDRYCIYQTIL